jgi:hypothetical protein
MRHGTNGYWGTTANDMLVTELAPTSLIKRSALVANRQQISREHQPPRFLDWLVSCECMCRLPNSPQHPTAARCARLRQVSGQSRYTADRSESWPSEDEI